MLLPLFTSAEATIGSKDHPVPESTAFEVKYEVMSFSDYDYVSGDISLSIVGQLPGAQAIDKIYENSLREYQGPKYFCFKILVEAKNLSRDVSIPIVAGVFKAYDEDFLESEILTVLSQVELLNGTKAYLYLGFRTPEGFPGYLVFNDTIWFDLRNVKFLDE